MQYLNKIRGRQNLLIKWCLIDCLYSNFNSNLIANLNKNYEYRNLIEGRLRENTRVRKNQTCWKAKIIAMNSRRSNTRTAKATGGQLKTAKQAERQRVTCSHQPLAYLKTGVVFGCACVWACVKGVCTGCVWGRLCGSRDIRWAAVYVMNKI